MLNSIKQLWDIVSKLAYIALVGILFISAVELFRIFLLFERIHPVIGYAYAATLISALLWAWLYVRRHLGRLPSVLQPPVIEDLETADFRSMKHFCKYLRAYLGRLAENPNLAEDDQEHALACIERIDDVLKAHPLLDDLRRLIVEMDEEGVSPLLDVLQEKAAGEVRTCVRDVMLAVTISPYRILDMLVVLYRNGSMVLRIAQIYESRPTLRAQLRIINDTLKIVVTVNVLNLSRNLMESIFSRMPLVGRVVEDISQGIGAGFFTSLAGHAAIARCSAYQGWTYEQAVEGIGSKSKRFLEDVRDLFLRDVLPQMKGRIRAADVDPSVEVSQSNVLDKLGTAISGAFDATGSTIQEYMLKPAMAGTQSVFRAGSRMVMRQDIPESVSDPEPGAKRQSSSRHSSRGHARRRRGLRRVLHTFGQRIKYGSIRSGM